jgi:hypothetical protein
MNWIKNTAACCFTLFLAACKKTELPILAHNAGNVTTAMVNMEANYKWQIYYDLESNTMVGQNLKTAWDLGFEATSDGYHIILNAAKAEFAINTGVSNFEAMQDTIGFAANKSWDEPTGNIDSTAIGDWRTGNFVYLIDRGYNEIGEHQGFRKIQFQFVDATHYILRFAQLDGEGDTVVQINKDDRYNFQFLSFTSNTVVLVEPPKEQWDLCFSQYTHIFYNPLMTYLVTGCLLNRNNTSAVMDAQQPFTLINYSQISNYTLSQSINVIGYDWKVFALGNYTTNPLMNYIIKNRHGYYYKLHFIDFYNSVGTKGNPKWEFQQL